MALQNRSHGHAMMHCSKYIHRNDRAENLWLVGSANQSMQRKSSELSSTHAAGGVQVAYERSPKRGK